MISARDPEDWLRNRGIRMTPLDPIPAFLDILIEDLLHGPIEPVEPGSKAGYRQAWTRLP